MTMAIVETHLTMHSHRIKDDVKPDTPASSVVRWRQIGQLIRATLLGLARRKTLLASRVKILLGSCVVRVKNTNKRAFFSSYQNRNGRMGSGCEFFMSALDSAQTEIEPEVRRFSKCFDRNLRRPA